MPYTKERRDPQKAALFKSSKVPQEVKSNTYKRIIRWIETDIIPLYGGQNATARLLGVGDSTLSGVLRFINISKADTFCSWLYKLGVKVFLPGEVPSECDSELKSLKERYDLIKEQNNYLKELLEEKKLRIEQYESLLNVSKNKNKHDG